MLSYTFLDVTTTGYQVQLLSNISFVGMIPQSEQDYQEMIQSLIKSPMTSLIQVCVLAPVMEEILMRGVVLGGLKNSYGTVRHYWFLLRFLHVYILIWCKRYQLFCAALIGAGGISYYRVMPTYHNPSGNKAYIMNMLPVDIRHTVFNGNNVMSDMRQVPNWLAYHNLIQCTQA